MVPDLPVDRLESAEIALSKNDLAQARFWLRLHLAAQPKDSSSWLRLYQIAEHPQESVTCLQHLLEIETAQLPIMANEVPQALEPLAVPTNQPSPRPISRPKSAPKAQLHKPQTTNKQSVGFKALSAWAGQALFWAMLILIAVVAGPLLVGDRALVILSGSMVPTIAPGSVVIVKPVDSSTLTVGDIIAYSPGPNAKIPLVHRIATLREQGGVRYFTTKGDANPHPDATEGTFQDKSWQLWYSVPLAGYVVNFASSPLGMVLLIGLPLCAMALLKIKDWWIALKQRPQPNLPHLA